MNICLFGGTFDPVHKGHIAIAHAAAEHFNLKRVLFCPATASPFKAERGSAPYAHRFAMLALATQGDKRFALSDLESPEVGEGDAPNYTIDTIRELRKRLGKSDRLFFLCGMDTFSAIARWREPEALLAAAEFIVAARPAHSVAEVAAALPPSLRPSDAVLKASRKLDSDSLVLRGATLHILAETAEPASSTAVRAALESDRSIARYLDPVVAEYIKRNDLYRSTRNRAAPAKANVIKSSERAPVKTRNRKRTRTEE